MANPIKAWEFINAIARKLLAKPTKHGEGITSIGNRMQAEAKASEIAEKFRASGLTPDKWDQFIKSEKDVIKYLNIIESTRKQAIEQATKKSSKNILKTTKKKKERPFTGWTPKVVTRSMPADDYSSFKEEWFGKILANTDEALNLSCNSSNLFGFLPLVLMNNFINSFNINNKPFS